MVNPDGNINFFDMEGQPLGYDVNLDILNDSQGEVLSKTDFVKSPMPGTVVKTYVKVGQKVKANEPLISVESMKMEFLIRATHDVTIKEIRVNDN